MVQTMNHNSPMFDESNLHEKDRKIKADYKLWMSFFWGCHF